MSPAFFHRSHRLSSVTRHGFNVLARARCSIVALTGTSQRRPSSSANDHESVHCRAVEKSSPSGDLRSTRATDFSPTTDPQNPAVWTGFFIVPSPACNPKEMDHDTDLARPHTDFRNQLQGLWLPLVTPFRDGKLDEASLRRLVRHYASSPIDGLILAATSGEGMTLGMAELERLVALTRAEISRQRALSSRSASGYRAPATAKMSDALDETAAWPIDGYLIASPYYTRPSQRGLMQHFTALADHASWPIVLYNIPYRTAVNLDQRDAAAARRTSQHRRPEGLLRRPRAVDRSAAPPARRLPRPDRRGRAILRRAHRRRRRRHPAVGPYRDREFCGGADAAEAKAIAMRRWRAGTAFADLTKLLFAEPSPAPAKYWLCAHRPDRQRRSAPADGGGERGAGGAAGCGDRAAGRAAAAAGVT